MQFLLAVMMMINEQVHGVYRSMFYIKTLTVFTISYSYNLLGHDKSVVCGVVMPML